MPSTMRAVAKTAAAPGAELIEVPIPTIGPNDILVQVKAASMCGTAVHTVFACDVPTQRVAVIGCGPIGLWAIAICKAIGAAAVYATDINPLRLGLAERMGAIALNSREVDVVQAVLDATGGEGV